MNFILPEDYGAIANGAVDCTSAFQQAVNISDTALGVNYTDHRPIMLFGRKYRITGTITSKQGALFIGRGPIGANPNQGTTIYHDGPGDCFVWDAGPPPWTNLASSSAVGGGLRDLTIYKAAKNGANNGGRAIYLRARASSYRPTDFKFENVLIAAEASGSMFKDEWYHLIHLDGRDCGPDVGAGIRNCKFLNVRAGIAQGDPVPTVLLQQVVGFSAQNLQLDEGGGGKVTVKVTDLCDTVNFLGVSIGGTLWFDESVGAGVNGWLCRTTISGKLTKSLLIESLSVQGAASVFAATVQLCQGSRFAVLGTIGGQPQLMLGV